MPSKDKRVILTLRGTEAEGELLRRAAGLCDESLNCFALRHLLGVANMVVDELDATTEPRNPEPQPQPESEVLS